MCQCEEFDGFISGKWLSKSPCECDIESLGFISHRVS